MKISIIIPTYNEEKEIAKLVNYLFQHGYEYLQEIIVVDGQSDDKTVDLARSAGANVLISEQRSRAKQLNTGASAARGDVLYFLHADSYPPENYTREIINSVNQGYFSGCYRLKFDKRHWFLDFNCWFTRFNYNRFRFGDQSLFITKELFEKIDGYNEDLIILEDQEIISRISKKTRFKVLKNEVVTSTRKYILNGIYKLQFIFLFIYVLYHLGFSQERLQSIYRDLVIQPKI